MNIDSITELRYIIGVTFKKLLERKKISGYALSKGTGIPYTTVCDLINGKTSVKNISLKNAILISDFLKISIIDFARLESVELIAFRYFRNNTLSELKRMGYKGFIEKVLNSKEIDFYYKNNGLDRALYLLALIDYLCRIHKKPIYTKRYNDLRKEKLDSVCFIDNDLFSFTSIEEAERELRIHVIPEFKKFNIVEEDVFHVA